MLISKVDIFAFRAATSFFNFSIVCSGVSALLFEGGVEDFRGVLGVLEGEGCEDKGFCVGSNFFFSKALAIYTVKLEDPDFTKVRSMPACK